MYSLYAPGVPTKRPKKITKVAVRTNRMGAPTTVRFPEELTEWVRLEGMEHPDGCAGVIRDAVATARRIKEQAQNRLRQHLLGALND